jgi:hypothetical protein
MNLTSSVICVSLLPQPGINQRLAAYYRARVERVPDRLLVEPDLGDDGLFLAGEPADDPDGDRRIERMGDAPQFVPAPDSFEGRGLLFRLSWKVVEFLQQRDRDGEKAPALLLGMSELAVEVVRPVDDHLSSMNPWLYNVKVIS